MIGTRPGVDLQQLFYKETEPLPLPIEIIQDNQTIYNADKSAEEELNDLIKDYK